MAWYKFYVAEFKNKHYPTPQGKVFLKFGITHHMDVQKRFDPTVDDGYAKNYEDWDIKILFSQVYKSKEAAENQEQLYLGKIFPYNSKYKVWVEDIFGLEDRNKYYTSTGVTELRLVDYAQKNLVLHTLFKNKKESGNIPAVLNETN